MVDLHGSVGIANRTGAAIDNRQAVVLDPVSLAPPGQSAMRGTVTTSIDGVGATAGATAVTDTASAGTPSAMFGTDAADGVAGSLGVNLAGGAGNLQHNGLMVVSLGGTH
ncbi:hypothetical protein [Burkholderia plantarii]|uniref:hypothetical protein n=1 Tax=Burkholderia plantarii TaxID=41899 RepID=UPI0005AF0116|nr:hypothetical protein [Burkholderia plantarii]